MVTRGGLEWIILAIILADCTPGRAENNNTRSFDMANPVPLYLDGAFVDSRSDRFIPNINPATQDNLGDVPCATEAEVNAAVASAKTAFACWKDVPVPERARLMMKFQALLKEHQDDIAETLARRPARRSPMPRVTSGAVSRWWSTPATARPDDGRNSRKRRPGYRHQLLPAARWACARALPRSTSRP